MKKTGIFLLLLILASTFANAQNLQRRGWLGVQFEDVSTEEAQRLKLPNANGVKVVQVFEGSSAEVAGLQAGDVIVGCNGEPINRINDLVALARQMNSGDDLRFTVFRNGRRRTYSGKVLPRPYESAENGKVIYGEMPFNDGLIRTIVNKPEGNGTFPAFFYLQGYTCSSIDNLQSSSTVKQLIEGMVARGYLVFRMEKPGVGDSYNLPNCREIGYDFELKAFQEGLAHLQGLEGVDPQNIFLFGHSLGGIAAPLMAAENPPKGIIVYGTVQKPWAEYLMDIYREQRQLFGMDFLKIENDARILFPLLNDYMVHKKSPSDLAENNPEYATALNSLGFTENRYILDRHYTFWQELQDKNLTEAWKKAGAHTFAIYGEADIAAINPKGHEAIAAIVNQYHPGKGKFLLFPNTDHGLYLTGTMEENLKLSPEERRQKPFNSGIVDILDEWMRGKMVL